MAVSVQGWTTPLSFGPVVGQRTMAEENRAALLTSRQPEPHSSTTTPAVCQPRVHWWLSPWMGAMTRHSEHCCPEASSRGKTLWGNYSHPRYHTKTTENAAFVNAYARPKGHKSTYFGSSCSSWVSGGTPGLLHCLRVSPAPKFLFKFQGLSSSRLFLA